MAACAAEAVAAEAATAAAVAEAAAGDDGDVMVITWPDGTIHRMPRGSTVRDLCAKASLEGASVCVNNNMVPYRTPLHDGDLVILPFRSSTLL